MLSGLGVGGGGSAQAMTCAADPPADAGCEVVFSVLALVCAGRLPSAPELPVDTGAAVVWPIACPPLG